MKFENGLAEQVHSGDGCYKGLSVLSTLPSR